MTPDDPAELDRFDRERREADARYNDALTALDRAVNDAAAGDAMSRDAAAAIGTALLVFLQQITAFVDTRDRELTARLAARLAEHELALAAIAELRTQITVLQRTVGSLKLQVISDNL